MGCAEVLLDAQEADRWRRGGCAPGLPLDAAAKGLLLQVEEARGPLDIGEHLERFIQTCLREGAYGRVSANSKERTTWLAAFLSYYNAWRGRIRPWATDLLADDNYLERSTTTIVSG